MTKRICANCGKKVYGFWVYARGADDMVCSKACLSRQIAVGALPRLKMETEYPELGINKERVKLANED